MRFARNLVLLTFAVAAIGNCAAAERPNIVVIVGDDMGYADVGFHGCKDIPTPNLDALAASGVRFTNGYVTGPYCSPTRAGFATGRYQTRFGHEFNPGGSAGHGLPSGETTLANRLSTAGYKTACIGKWHLGETDELHPLSRGYGDFYGFLGGAHDYFDRKGVFSGRTPLASKGTDYLTDALARESVAFIEAHKAEPFFLYLAFNAVHTPMQADDARLMKFASITDKQRRTYAAMMFALDEAVGKVRQKLTETGLDKNTLVVFFSDNGGPTMTGTTMNGSSNAPLRGSKRTTLEGGVRVPFVMSWPGKLQPGKVYDSPVIQLDAHATALAAAGVAISPEWKLDGVDLLPYLTGENTGIPHEALYWRFGQQLAIRDGDWKLVRYDTAADGDKPGVTAAKLYNLKDDLGEKNDLIAKLPEKARELQSKWDAWNRSNIDPLWGGGGRRKNARAE
jgi:arylsulfatase A-like enzyme